MNRHLKIAIIVAPFLSIGGYALVDQYQYYQQQNQAKALYPLEVAGDCNLVRGCELHNANLSISIDGSRQGDGIRLKLLSDQDLRGGKLGYGDTGDEIPQRSLQKDGDARSWAAVVPLNAVQNARPLTLRMVLVDHRGRVNIAELPASIDELFK